MVENVDEPKTEVVTSTVLKPAFIPCFGHFTLSRY